MENNKTSNQSPYQITELGTLCVMHDNYTAQEEKYIFMMEVFDQPAFHEVIRQKAHHGQLNLKYFRHTDSCRQLIIPYKALEPHKSHYQQLEKALISIGSKAVGLPYTKPNPEKPSENILDYVKVDYLFHFEKSIKKGQIKYAVIDMPFKVAQYIYSIDLGYHKIIPSLYLSFHHQYTRRLYQLAETRIKQGHKDYFPKQLNSLISSNGAYKGVGDLCYDKLDTAKDEFKSAYDKNLIDYHITYDVDNGTKNKNAINLGKKCTKVLFTINWRRDDMKCLTPKQQSELSMKRFKIKRKLTNEWKVTEWVADDIVKKITLDNYEKVEECEIFASSRVRNPGKMSPITNQAGYIVACLKKVFA